MSTPAATDPNRFATALFAGLPDRYDRLAEVLSLGQNRRWRRAMVGRVVAGLAPGAGRGAPLRILDVASGTAGVATQLAERLGAQVVGVDLSEDMLRRGARNLEAWRASRPGHEAEGTAGGAGVALVAGRAEQLPFPDACFDGLTFTYLLRYVADVDATLAELARVVKPGAPVASLDFLVPSGAFWRASWWGYTRLVLPLAGWSTGGPPWRRVGRFLGPNISEHCRRHPVGALVGAWRRAGLEDVGTRPMSLGGGLVMWGRRATGRGDG